MIGRIGLIGSMDSREAFSIHCLERKQENPMRIKSFIVMIVCVVCAVPAGAADLVFGCAADNDLYRVMTADGTAYPRYDSAAEAVEQAPACAGVLILAAGYPATPTAIDDAVFAKAASKKLRLYVEYPTSLPGMDVDAPKRVDLERAVVASAVFGKTLERGRILAIHDCHYVGVKAADAHIVLAKVAGLDSAVFGLDDVETAPLLFRCADRDVLVSTTKLSQFVTARYAPKAGMQAIWRMVLSWLRPAASLPHFDWTPTVRPTYARDEALPKEAARQAVIRGIDWHTNARMFMDTSWRDKYDEFRSNGVVDPHNPVGPRPDSAWPSGDGEFGVLEGVSSRIQYNGEQPIRWWLRTDSNGESSLAFALRSKLDGDKRSAKIAGNLLDWLYFKSGLFKNDPEQANFGLNHWAYDSISLYGDNDIRIILGCIGTSALLDTDRWDEALLQNILGNYRTTGRYGFRSGALRDDKLLEKGWLHYWKAPTLHFAPHYEAWIWSSYLWLYDKTGYAPLLERTRSAIRMMMDNYPDGWRWTNGIQQERGRMLLTLAWLVRVDDTQEHRGWLKRMADDMLRCQDACGGIREELGPLANGAFRPPQSNAAYGTSEASLIQANGDPVADLLYTCNFAFLGLHEAYAATGETQYRDMADQLAEFLVRVQVRSEAHPELDGVWFRAFDFNQWEYWGSNADHGWGAWSVEVGWTQGWVPTVLSMRTLGLNLWDMSKDSGIAEHWEKTRAVMLPDSAFEALEPEKVAHDAVGKPVTLTTMPDARYPGGGAGGLTDGCVGFEEHLSPEWHGFEGGDMDAVIDLGESTAISAVTATCMQSTKVGIILPRGVEVAVSDDGKAFRVVATVQNSISKRKAGPLRYALSAEGLDVRGRYVRVRAVNIGTIPKRYPATGKKAWLFVDEIMVNPHSQP